MPQNPAKIYQSRATASHLDLLKAMVEEMAWHRKQLAIAAAREQAELREKLHKKDAVIKRLTK